MKKSRYWLFFHAVFLYVVIFFIWWSYLLHKNNYQNYHEAVSAERNAFIAQGNSETAFYDSADYRQVRYDFHRTEFMLYLEGVLFIALISLGFFRIRSTFREEIALTRRQNNFLLSITHELKSPLASLKLSMETLRKHTLAADKVKQMAGMSLEDVERLEALVENILLASRIESSDFRLDRELVNLSEITRGIFRRVCEKTQRTRAFTSDIPPNIYIHADRLSLSSVIYNLIENAIKYSSPGDVIAVSLEGDDTEVKLRIADTGFGIPEGEKMRIFERFYRIGREETRRTSGTGLGLFIVKQIVTLHDGRIEVKNNTPKGSIFEITLPVG